MAAKRLTTDAMADELREIARHAGALLDATAEEADERVQNARENLRKRLDAAKNQYAELDDLLDEKLQAADRLIHDKPYHAVGGSFLIGLVLGWLMSRK
ncbi:ElaB/YgaM/YqjD family protein [Solidesulfovibrio sp.]